MKANITLLAAFAVVLGIAAPVAAQDNEVVMGNYLLLRIRCASGGYSVQERTEIIQRRANNVLTYGRYNVNDISTKPVGSEVAVYVGDELLITADWCEARANRTTPAGLAKVWAARLREILPLARPRTPAEAQRQ